MNQASSAKGKQNVEDDEFSQISGSSFASEDDVDNSIVGDWLEEEEEEVVVAIVIYVSNFLTDSFSQKEVKEFENNDDYVDENQCDENSEPLDPYIEENRLLYNSLVSVADLRFASLSPSYQVELMKTLKQQW